MRIAVSSILLVCLILFGCDNTKDSAIYVSNSNNRILLISHSEIKILHSGIATLCDRFEIIDEGISSCKLKSINEMNSFDLDSLSFIQFNDSLMLNNIVFYKFELTNWDSIVINELKNNKVLDSKAILPGGSFSGEKQLLATTLLLRNFEYLDTLFVESNSSVDLKLYQKDNVIGSKYGANLFTCIDYQ